MKSELNLSPQRSRSSNPFFFISLILFALSVFRCEDEKPKTELEKLPPATQEGKGTFGCLVNGKAWVIESTIDASGWYLDGWLHIRAGVERSGQTQQIRFYILDTKLGLKDYLVSNNPESFAVFIDRPSPCTYETISGRLTITGRGTSARPYLSGTFEFKAYSDACSDTLKVTHGRFDIY